MDERHPRHRPVVEREEMIRRGRDPRRDDEPPPPSTRGEWRGHQATKGDIDDLRSDLDELEAKLSQHVNDAMAPILAAWGRAEQYRVDREAKESQRAVERESDKRVLIGKLDEVIAAKTAQIKDLEAIQTSSAARVERKEERADARRDGTRKYHVALLVAVVPIVSALIALATGPCISHASTNVHVEHLAIPPDRKGKS